MLENIGTCQNMLETARKETNKMLNFKTTRKCQCSVERMFNKQYLDNLIFSLKIFPLRVVR